VTSSTSGEAGAAFWAWSLRLDGRNGNNAGMTGIPARLLGEGENVEMAMRPHWKALVWPALLLLVVSPVTTYLVFAVPDGSAQRWLRVVLVVLAALVLVRWALWPFLRWLTTSYVVTDRRLITRRGIIARQGRDMPLSRINDVTFGHSGLLERVLGCGTLVVESAGERGQLVLADVPKVEEVQRDVYRLAEQDEGRRRSRHDGDDTVRDEPGRR
jgi:uncharacterized membrane protein YdbT with pleckstrin-like domain